MPSLLTYKDPKNQSLETTYLVIQEEPLGAGTFGKVYKCRKWSAFDDANIGNKANKREQLSSEKLKEYIDETYTDEDFNYVVKIINHSNEENSKIIEAEGKISYDVQLAPHPAFEINLVDDPLFPDETIQQRCIVLSRLDRSLHKIIDDEQKNVDSQPNETAQPFDAVLSQQELVELDRAINLSLHVSNLHDGSLSRSRTPYGHGDIKPENIFQDKNGNLRLIDFGTAGQLTDAVENTTPMYAPINAELLINKNCSLLSGLFQTLQTIPGKRSFSLAETDRISLLRTLKHPLDGEVDSKKVSSILSTSTFAKLPEDLRDFLDTSVISVHFEDVRNKDTVKLIAAVIILYRDHPADFNKANIARLRENISLQNEILNHEQIRLKQQQNKQENKSFGSVSPPLSPFLESPPNQSTTSATDASAAVASAFPLSSSSLDISSSEDNSPILQGSPPPKT